MERRSCWILGCELKARTVRARSQSCTRRSTLQRPTNAKKMFLPSCLTALLLVVLPTEVLSSSYPLTGFFDVESGSASSEILARPRHVPIYSRSALRKRSTDHLAQWALREKARVRGKYGPSIDQELTPLRRRQNGWPPGPSPTLGVVNVTNFQADS